MSAAIGSAKSTVSRIARTLELEGFLLRIPNKDGYRLGLKLWELGSQAILEHSEFGSRILPHLEELVGRVNESAQAAILDGQEVVYVQRVDALHSLRPFIPLGARFPAYCTATGKALLAFQLPAVVDAVVRAGLKAYTSKTITRGPDLRKELAGVGARGYAIAKGEWRADIGGIAAPVFDRNGRTVGAIGVTMPLTRFPRGPGSSHARAVIATAKKLSLLFGHTESAERSR